MTWAYGSYVGGQVLVLLGTAVLARLLAPRDFGLVALALVFVTILETIKDLGVTQALVIAKDDEAADTAFLVSVGLGGVLALVVALIAPLAADVFSEPDLTPLLAVLGLTFVLRALGSTHYALAQRALDFRTRTKSEFADVLVRSIIGIVLAFAGAGAWSLIVGYLAGAATKTVVLWVEVRWRPRLRLQRHLVRSLVRFGAAVTAVDLLATYNSNADNFFVGRVLGATSLGFYSIAYRVPILIIQNLANVAGQVLFPAFAAVQSSSLGRSYLAALRATLYLVIPLTVLLAVLAEPVLVVCFGQQWAPAADAMAVLTVFAGITTIAIPSGTAYKAMGKPGILLLLSIPRAIFMTVALVFVTKYGLVSVAATQAVASALLATAAILVAARMLRTGLKPILSVLGTASAAALGMLAVVLPLDRALDGVWTRLLVVPLPGLVVYGLLLWLLARQALLELYRKARPGPVAPPPAMDDPVADGP